MSVFIPSEARRSTIPRYVLFCPVLYFLFPLLLLSLSILCVFVLVLQDSNPSVECQCSFLLSRFKYHSSWSVSLSMSGERLNAVGW